MYNLLRLIKLVLNLYNRIKIFWLLTLGKVVLELRIREGVCSGAGDGSLRIFGREVVAYLGKKPADGFFRIFLVGNDNPAQIS